jgi:hypothetical protein
MSVEPLPEETRKEVFAALVEAQDRKVSVSQSRSEIASRFGLTPKQLERIEEEGVENEWPPLGN